MLRVSSENLFKKSTTSFPNIQFIWVGMPKTVDILHPEMDLAGPLQFYDFFCKNKMDHKIIYYCLDEHCEEFRALLKPTYNIEIRGLETCFEKNYEVIKKNNLTDAITIFNENKIGDIHEKVSAKNLASLLILYLYGDYFLDTTIFPTEKIPDFKTYSFFQAPLLSEDALNILSRENLEMTEETPSEKVRFPTPTFYVTLSLFGNTLVLDSFEEKCLKKLTGRNTTHPLMKAKTMDIDCFIMFSPQYSFQVLQAISCFISFYPLVKEEKIRAEQTNDPELLEHYHNSDDTLMLLSVTNGYYLHPVKRQARWYADLTDHIEGEAPSRIIKPLNIRKVFRGSHVVQLDSSSIGDSDEEIMFTF